MRNALWILALLLALPTVSANTADIPALTGTTQTHFVASWATVNGATQIGGVTLFLSMFGDSIARLTETNQVNSAPFRYNVTNMRVTAGAANCGNLGGGETLTITLRINGVDTILTSTCAGGAAAGSSTVDTDVVEVLAGDRMTYSAALAGTALTRNPQIGISMDGYANFTVNTNAVPDMVNEMLETFNVIAPLLFFAVVVIWAEFAKSPLLYILAAVVGMLATAAVWTEVENLRFIVAALTLVCLVRALQIYNKNGVDTE